MSDGEGRVFVRELVSQTYGLDEFRRRQLAAPRVRSPKGDVSILGKAGYTEDQDAWWRVGPGDDPFWTQTLQVHLVELPARGAAKGHGHQNEAPFYILEGAGYEIHDDQRYDWTKGDLVLVHTDSVHQHFNPYDEPALTLVIKAKSTWLFAGLMQQGNRTPFDREEEFGPREDWSQVWTPGVTGRKKIVSKDDAHWETNPLGRVRVLSGPERPDVRQFSADVFELDIPAGSRSGKHWKMADEILYVVEGEGYSLHWEVQAEIAERGFPLRCRKVGPCAQRQGSTTRARMRSCGPGSTRTGSAWTTWTGCAGLTGSSARTCAGDRGWRELDSRWHCAGCDRRVSVTAGTIFHGTRTPLTVWFSAAWLMVNSKTGISATQLQREMELGSIQTAWAMLHRYRSVMVRPGRDRLHGDVEVDESFLGGPEPGVPGRGALGKVLFAGAVELDDKGFGRARLGVIPTASTVSLTAFLDANVEPGSRVITDGWSAYPAATRDRYEHTGTSVAASGLQAHEVLPAVHRVFSLVKRWLMGTMQGSVSPEHVQAYFDEWVFRFNRRHSRSRGLLFHTLLQNAIAGDPVTYQSLRKAGRTRTPPPPPRGPRAAPPSLDVGRPELPWRNRPAPVSI